MTILRVVLVLALLAGCSCIAFMAPWQARLAPDFFTTDLGSAPVWQKPEAPGIEAFEIFENLSEPPQGSEIVVELNKRKIFGLLSLVVVGSFFLFGLAGTIVQRRPETSDVAFSLWISIGMIGGVIVSGMLSQAMNKGQFPFFSECLLVGFVAGLMIAIRSRTRLPASRKSSA